MGGPVLRRQRSQVEKMLPSHRNGDGVRIETNNSHDAKSLQLTDLTVRVDEPRPSAARALKAGPSRWRTSEFRFYALVFAVVVPVMVWVPVGLSMPSHPNYSQFAPRLSEGWLFRGKVDMSDPQYRSFRNNLIPLLELSSAYLVCSHLYSYLVPSMTPRARATFIAGFAVTMLIILHGASAVKIIGILGLNYVAAKSPKSTLIAKGWPAALMVGNMAILFLNERYDGYKLGGLHAALGALDDFAGVLPRWHVSFNITMLRIVSFGMDWHWQSTSVTVPHDPVDYRGRVKTSLNPEEYSWINYVAYCLYPPLYIAGPIMTFNDFVHQLHRPVPISVRDRLLYGVRFLCCLLTMEAILHTMYMVAIKDAKAWLGDTTAELCMIGFWNLVIVWLKLLIPWRFFRLWALLDGMDAPENMIRCVANNYSTMQFWKSWHRSYNLWVVRYLYIPVGGNNRKALSTLVVFTFVALWHDLSTRLLAWGWLVSLFILPELIATAMFPQSKYGEERWYRHVCAVGAVLNILMMMSANLVGFVLGLDGMKYLVAQISGSWSGLGFLAFASACLFVAAQVMFEYREEEKRRGIDRKC